LRYFVNWTNISKIKYKAIVLHLLLL